MAKLQLTKDFSEFLRSLDSHGVEYLLVGGYAVGYHGYPRATGDMDIWVHRTPDNARRLVSAFKEFGFNVPELSENLFLERHQVIRMGVPPNRIEVLTDPSGVTFADCYAERIEVPVKGMSVKVISLMHLKANKKAAGRHKDLADLENLP